MRLIGLRVENYMRVRFLEIAPKSRIVQFTGRNGQGKTSAVMAFWNLILGKTMTPDKPVRKGAQQALLQADLGTLLITRTINPDRSQVLTVEPAQNGRATGKRFPSPQALIDELRGSLKDDMPQDPVEFLRMPPKQQIEVLRKLAAVDLDFEAMAEANKADYEARRVIGRDVDRMVAEASAITVQQGLPAAKLDEMAVLERMRGATAANEEARRLDVKKAALTRPIEAGKALEKEHEVRILSQLNEIEQLKADLLEAERNLPKLLAKRDELRAATKNAEEIFEIAPAGVMVDVSALSAELQEIQTTNREIEKRERREAAEKALAEERRKADALTRAMEGREEKKRAAMAAAKMPIEGLSFDEMEVLYQGIPLQQIGDAKGIEVCMRIFMATNPKLRVLPIWRGEALDEDNLAMMEQLCEENDFQVLMARVDSSGEVGVVMEDGVVVAEHEVSA
jgi:hypothetical protein